MSSEAITKVSHSSLSETAMPRRPHRRRNAHSLISYIILDLFSVVVGYPVLWMLFQSFKSQPEMYQNVWGPPRDPQIQNYIDAWNLSHIGRYSINSLIVAFATVLGVLTVASLAAYAFSKMRFAGSRLIFGAIIFSLLLPVPIIPLYAVVSGLHLTDTYFAVIFPYISGGLPLSIFLLKAFFESLPSQIEDAARIDGCSNLGILWHVVLPLSKPGLATVAIFTFINAWNEFFLALIFIRSREIRTIPIGLQVFFQDNATKWPALFATLSMATVPIVVVYVLMQQQFIEGLTAGAVKG